MSTLAICMYNKGRYNDAAIIFSNLLISNELDRNVTLCNRSACYIKLGKYKEALEDLKEVLRNNPNWAKAWGRLGASLYGLSQYDKSLKAYNKAYELEKDNNIATIYKNMIEIIEDKTNKGDFNSILTSILSNKDVMNTINDNNFKTKVLSYSNNPFGLLKDKEVMGLLNNVLSKLDIINNF